ncbi:fumarylacetoacetate hydrolase family protein [Aeromicrobium sp. CF4.19]|uniref:fumarylacetoacetate hydrolase family protein n=1 Tax=Aeromicrobium sp. CF4.19 TaxID=3373082 RepID=UPI003EE6186C
MKYVTYAEQGTGTPRVGVLDAEAGTIAPLPADAAPEGLLSVVDHAAAGEPAAATEPPVSVGDVRLLAPLPRPRHDVVCVGKNYAEHAAEFARSGRDATGSGPDVPSAPIFFTKAPSTVVGPDDVVDPHLGLTDALDYEAEIAVIIGRGGRGIRPEDAMDHVWGYTLVNDVTARDLQERHKQWFLGKSLDTFCPMGPWAVTADEVDLSETWLECRVNGELRQNACTTDLIFDVPTLVATLSAGITLAPGDVIATGTPAGVALGFDPPRYLVPGDVVEVSATNLGVLRNVIGEGSR